MQLTIEAMFFGLGVWGICSVFALFYLASQGRRGKFLIFSVLMYSTVLSMILGVTGLAVGGIVAFFGHGQTLLPQSLGVCATSLGMLILLYITGRIPHFFQ